MTYDKDKAAALVAEAMAEDHTPIGQCEAFDGMSNTRCAFVAGHGADHLFSRGDASDEIRLRLLRDNRDRREPLLRAIAEQLAACMERLREVESQRQALAQVSIDTTATLQAERDAAQAEVARLRLQIKETGDGR